MAVKYDFMHNPAPKDEQGKRALHPRIVVNGTVEMNDIAKDIAQHSSFTEGTVKGVLEEFSKYLREKLTQGYNVKMGETGTFSASLSSRTVEDPSEIRASSVEFSNVKFRPTPAFMRDLRMKGKLERAEFGFVSSSSKWSKEQRWEKLETYLNAHGFIARTEYGKLTGLRKTLAWKDLNGWEEEGKLAQHGRKPHLVYSLRKQIE